MPGQFSVTDISAVYGNYARNGLGLYVSTDDSLFKGPLVQSPFDTIGRGSSGLMGGTSDLQFGPLGGYTAFQGIGPSLGGAGMTGNPAGMGAVPAAGAGPLAMGGGAAAGGDIVAAGALAAPGPSPASVAPSVKAPSVKSPGSVRAPSARAPTLRGPSRHAQARIGGESRFRSRGPGPGSPPLEWQDETGSQIIVEEERGNVGARENDPAQAIVEEERGNAAVRAASPAQQIVEEERGAPRLSQNGRVLVDRRSQGRARTANRRPETQDVYATDPRVVRRASQTPGPGPRPDEMFRGPRQHWNERANAPRRRTEPRTQWNERPPRQSMRERIFGP